MAELYNDNPTVSHTLHEFCARAKRIYDGDQADDAFIRFVLTGEFVDDDDGATKQVFLDPIQNMVKPEHPLNITRDYDSLLGFADRILVDGPITVYAVPHPTFALTTSIHMQYRVTHGAIDKDVDYHRIPNFEFGKFGARHHLNIFFPRLWSPERRGSRLTERERAFWYENGMRPAIVASLGENIASEWPATYKTERIRAMQHSGNFSWQTKIIPKETVVHLTERIRAALRHNPLVADEDIAWAEDFFVLHTVRGAKHSSFHHVDPDSASFYLEDFIEDAQLSDRVSEVGEWFIDVALEISSGEGDCLQWVTHGHHEIVRQVLDIPRTHAARITSITSSKYSRDPASHLTAISGFRIVPGVQAQGEFEAAYIQAYTTDKAVVHNAEAGHHAKFLTTKEAMGPQQPSKTIDGVYDIYMEASRVNSSNARVEVRVPYRFATEVLLQYQPDELRRQCLCTFTPQEWWSFRVIRLTAISQTLAKQALANSSLRLKPEALTLTAACIWLFNGLHARPEDGPAARRLMDAALPVTEAAGANPDVLAYNTSVRGGQEEEEEEESDGGDSPGRVPYNPYGGVFFRRMMIGDVPRFRYGGRDLCAPAFKYWFDGMSLEEVKAKYTYSGIVDKDAVARTRSTTNKGKIPNYVNWTGGALEPDLFNLGAQGNTTIPPDVDDGSDLEDMSPPPADSDLTANSFLSRVWRQFVVDVTAKSPNPRGNTNPSYLKLTTAQRLQGNEDVFKTLHLSTVFHAVAYKNGSSADWQRAFKWFFPPPGYKTSSAVQNYPSCPYYQQWMGFIDKPPNKELVLAMRDELWKRFRTWSWVPDAHQDKIWATKAATGFTRWPATKGPAPRILLKSTDTPVFSEVGNDDGSDGDVVDESDEADEAF